MQTELNPYMENVFKEKAYLVMLCLKDLHQEENLNLYETGIIALYYAYKLYQSKDIYHENFDYLAYQFILFVMRYYIHKDIQ